MSSQRSDGSGNGRQAGRGRPWGGMVTAAGVEHVRLAYHYLDTGDVDGYGSLLDEDVELCRPDAPPGHGRDEVVRLHQEGLVPPAPHAIDRIVAEGDSVVVVGRTGGVGFVDVFTLSPEAMLRGCRRYYGVAP
ncbi:nuclear transport factor 2 family protein [Streptomyces bambusae]|uniref:nuclear transport factor 2 family protein n=1 Tax=Streptomyces bambusae TaxID=1550616 RepID=UPI001CFE5C44|nr:nuclear transport factor 2 family protein [Streptomyces bambusae]MCB5163528.1 nuclear transport factor 2 family protein [Streptomyces bambusae]